MTDLWVKRFCVYEKSSKILTMVQNNQGTQNNSLKIQSEEYQLVSCERKMSNTIDRRFSFGVKIKNINIPLTLQALTKEDLIQWMMIMDGNEPIYAQPNVIILNQEPETILNDKAMKFITKCFSEIEKRGLDSEGLYRTTGFTAQRDALLKKVIIDIAKPSVDLKIEREIEHIDVDTICSLVKSYIKYLKIPMATYILYDEFIAAGKLQNPSDKFNAVLKLIRKLPSDHFHLFFILINHLNKVTQYNEKNLMTAPNLGVCFSPTIFRPEFEKASLTTIREAKFNSDIISLLIERCFDFFPQFNSYQKNHLNQSKSFCEKEDSREMSNLESNRSNLPLSNLKRYNTDINSAEQKNVILKPPILRPKPSIAIVSPKSDDLVHQWIDGNYSKSSEMVKEKWTNVQN